MTVPGPYCRTGFFRSGFMFQFPLNGFEPDRLKLEWKPSEAQINQQRDALLVAPYVGARQGSFEAYLLGAFTVDLTFDVPLDRLTRVKSVDARDSSRNNATHR